MRTVFTLRFLLLADRVPNVSRNRTQIGHLRVPEDRAEIYRVFRARRFLEAARSRFQTEA
jgi:hypothetical protein